MSHEFRTPLTVIKEYVSLLREGVVGESLLDSEQCRFLDVVADRADDLNTMVDDMLDVSKLESGLLGVWRKTCHVRQIIDHVRPALEKKAEVKDVSFQVFIDDDLPKVFCDPEKIGRVIINLVINAIKFCGQPGRVRISASRDDSGRDIIVEVSDNGGGIDEDGLAEIFERFRQLGTQARGTSKGFGLGLNIARELVELNFGEMRVASRVGRGSTFSFTVPIADPLEVVSRFVARTKDSAPVSLSLISAHIDQEVHDALADDVDAALNYLQHENGLIVRRDRHSWLLVLVDVDCGEFVEKVQHGVEATNRNRTYEPLPQIELAVEGRCDTTEDNHELICLAAQYFQMEVEIHAGV